MKAIVPIVGIIIVGVIFIFGYVPYRLREAMMIMHCYRYHARDF